MMMSAQRWWKLTSCAAEMRLDRTLRNGQSFVWTKLYTRQWNAPVPEEKIESAFVGCVDATPLVIVETSTSCYYSPLQTTVRIPDTDVECSHCRIARYFRTTCVMGHTGGRQHSDESNALLHSPSSDSQSSPSFAQLYALWGFQDQLTLSRTTQLPGVRILHQPLVECVLEFICSANNHRSRITGMVQHLAHAYGCEHGIFALINVSAGTGVDMATIRADINRAYENYAQNGDAGDSSSQRVDYGGRVVFVRDIRYKEGMPMVSDDRTENNTASTSSNAVVSSTSINIDTADSIASSGDAVAVAVDTSITESSITDATAVSTASSINASSQAASALSTATIEQVLRGCGGNMGLGGDSGMGDNGGAGVGVSVGSTGIDGLCWGVGTEGHVWGGQASGGEAKAKAEAEGGGGSKGKGKKTKEGDDEDTGAVKKSRKRKAASVDENKQKDAMDADEWEWVWLPAVRVPSSNTTSTSTYASVSAASIDEASGNEEATVLLYPYLPLPSSAVITVPLASYPVNKQLLSLSEQPLRQMGCGYRAKYLSSAATDMSRPGWVSEVVSSSPTQQLDALTRLSGVGRKVADCVRLFALSGEDTVPLDTHVLQTCLRDHAAACAWVMAQSVVNKEREHAMEARDSGVDTTSTSAGEAEQINSDLERLWARVYGWGAAGSVSIEAGSLADQGRRALVAMATEIQQRAGAGMQSRGSEGVVSVGAGGAVTEHSVEVDSDATEVEERPVARRRGKTKAPVKPKKSKKTIKDEEESMNVPRDLDPVLSPLWRSLTTLYGDVWALASAHVPSPADVYGDFNRYSHAYSLFLAHHAPAPASGAAVAAVSGVMEGASHDNATSEAFKRFLCSSASGSSSMDVHMAAATIPILPPPGFSPIRPGNPGFTPAPSIAELMGVSAPQVPTPSLTDMKALMKPALHDAVTGFYRLLWGDKCGWAHSVLFTAELDIHK